MTERITPQASIDHFTSTRDITIEEIGVAPVVVISWGRKVVEDFARRHKAEMPEHWIYGERNPLHTTEIDGQSVSFHQPPVGAPGTIMIMEELIACGVHTFIGLGWAGGLQPHAPIGSLLLPTSCVSEEGTSSHYVDDISTVAADPDLLASLRQAARDEGVQTFEGSQWTTDAPFRELKNTIEIHRQQGVLGVDMETSAMYALGQFRGVRVANLLVVSDEVWREWNPAFGSEALANATSQAMRIVERAVALGAFSV